MKFLLPLLILLSLPTHAQEFPCVVSKITDGDTFHCTAAGEDVTVRIIGVDCPEMPSPEGKTAKEYVQKIIPIGTVVRLELDVQPLDYFRRTLAYVWLPSGKMLNEVLLREGVAALMTVPPNVKYADRLIKNEENLN